MPNRLFAGLLMAAAVVCGVMWVPLLVVLPAGSPLMRPHWPLATVLAWDAALSFVFFLQHSGMVRRQFRTFAASAIPPHHQNAFYAIASGVTLTFVFLLWQTSPIHIFVLQGLARQVFQAGSILAIFVIFWGAYALRKFDPFGLAPIRANLHGKKLHSPSFVVRGPYRWVRHPLYLGVLLLIWADPHMTADRLLFNVLWTTWICIGARLEEADLSREFGDVYERYRQHVPFLIPWRGRLKVGHRHSFP